jgi:hypothetical protein
LGSLFVYSANEGGDRVSSEFSDGPDEKLKPLVIEHYGDRYFALYDGEDLVCVTVYKKGALEVKRRLEMTFIQRDG